VVLRSYPDLTSNCTSTRRLIGSHVTSFGVGPEVGWELDDHCSELLDITTRTWDVLD
jgi:hypothetical protein